MHHFYYSLFFFSLRQKGASFPHSRPPFPQVSEVKSLSTMQFKVDSKSAVMRQDIGGCRWTEKLYAFGRSVQIFPYWPLIIKRCGYMKIRGEISIRICINLWTLSNGGIIAILTTGYVEFQGCLYVFFLVVFEEDKLHS